MSARAGTARLLFATGALLLGCGGAHGAADPLPDDAPAAAAPAPASNAREAPAVGRTRAVTARELAAIRELMAAAERVRALRFEREVPVLVQDAEAIMAYVDGQIEDDELERARIVYTALGLLDPKLDVRALLLRLMGEQIVGYYDVDRHRLIVRDDVMRALGGARDEAIDLAEARVVLVHELVHALQDQHLGLPSAMHEERDSDASNALRALVEGDATLAMIAFAMQSESVSLSELTSNPARVRSLSELVRSSPLAGSELGNAPAIVRVPLLSAYVDGLTFVANLHGDGGWGRVDRAHADPPVSTEQVLHPERFARRHAAERLRLPDAAGLFGADHPLVHEDSLGELEMRVYFAQAAGERSAERAAHGWGGDRLYAYRRGELAAAIVWISSWDDEREAVQAEDAAARVLAAAPDEARREQLVVRVGRKLLIARNVPEPLQKALHERFTSWAGSEQRPRRGRPAN